MGFVGSIDELRGRPKSSFCLMCGCDPVITLFLFQVRPQGLSGFEWGLCAGEFCRADGSERARAWLLRAVLRGWWSVGAFLPNFAAAGCNLLALVRATRLPPRYMTPRAGSLVELASTGSLPGLSWMTEGIGYEAWTRESRLPAAPDPSAKTVVRPLVEAERWGLSEDDED
jgi:hypothetical protein